MKKGEELDEILISQVFLEFLSNFVVSIRALKPDKMIFAGSTDRDKRL